MRAGSMTSPACAPHIGQAAHLSPLRRLLVTLWAQPMSNFNLNLRPLLFDSAQSLEAPSVQELPRARSVEMTDANALGIAWTVYCAYPRDTMTSRRVHHGSEHPLPGNKPRAPHSVGRSNNCNPSADEVSEVWRS